MPVKTKKRKPVTREEKKESLENLEAIIGLAEFFQQEDRMKRTEGKTERSLVMHSPCDRVKYDLNNHGRSKIAQKIFVDGDDMELHVERGIDEPNGEKVGESIKIPAGSSWLVFGKAQPEDDDWFGYVLGTFVISWMLMFGFCIAKFFAFLS